MRNALHPRSALLAFSLVALLAPGLRAQEVDDQLLASHRLFKTVGPGLRALRRGASGRYYLLTSAGLLVFDADGKPLATIGAPGPEAGSAKPGPPLTAGVDCDVDSAGNVYVADRGDNRVHKFAPDGSLLHSFAVRSPLSVAALPDGEFAVSSLDGERLVSVYDSAGKRIRDFGELEELSERPAMNRYLSLGRLASAGGRLYFGYTYLPEPRVRQYDGNGYAGIEFEFTGLGAWSEGRGTRKEIERQDKRLETPSLHPVLTAFGVDPVNGDLWMCLHNTLLHFDKEGNRQSEYQIYTPEGTRLEATVLVVEEDRLLIGADPLGVFEFHRPDRKP